jgi:predicted CopG family antitoxin
MKKRINLTLDEDVYEGLGEIPRRVSVSELVNWLLKVFVAELKAGRELTSDELIKLTDNMSNGEDFRKRFKEQFGPKLEKVQHLLDTGKKAFGIEGKLKKGE